MIRKGLNKWQYIYLSLLLFVTSCKPVNNIIELNPSTSTIITGIGPNQDAFKNPYAKGESIAIVTNIGVHSFDIRVESNGVKVKRATINPNETKEIDLLPGQQLYFISRLKSKAKVRFKGVQNYF